MPGYWWGRDHDPPQTLGAEVKKAASNAALELIHGRGSETATLRFNRRIAGLIDSKLQALPLVGPKNACTAGCHACCEGAVPSIASEAVPIAKRIKEEWPQDQIDALVDALVAQTSALTHDFDCWESRFRGPCPLLKDGMCSVYDLRPVHCRVTASFDAELCSAWKSKSTEIANIPCSNGERVLGKEVLSGLEPHLQQLVQVMPLQFHLLSQLAPDRFPKWSQSRPDWYPALPPAARVVGTRWHSLAASREVEPFSIWTRRIAANDLAESLVGLDFPSGYEREGEFQESLGRLESEVERIEETEFASSARDAFHAVEAARYGRITLSDFDVRPLIERIGRILESKVARSVAPDLLEPLGARHPGKPRFGLISSNLGLHSSSSWALELVRRLKGDEVETYVFNCREARDDLTHEFRAAADVFYNLHGDRLATARFIRNCDLDYALFAEVGDGGANLQLAMFRLGRVQAAGWGCPCTSGMPQIDEYLSSELWETQGSEKYYTERLVRLPGHGVTYARPDHLMKSYGRESFGLPPGHLAVIAQNLMKWRPEDDWLVEELASRLQNGLFVVNFGGSAAVEAFRRRMDSRKIKITYLPTSKRYAYIHLTSLFDVSLDAPTFHGGHSSLATLAAGTPVLSLVGSQLRSRMGYAFQTVAQIPDAAVTTPMEFIDKATSGEWALDARSRLDTSGLFDFLPPVHALRNRILSLTES